jgi:V8-like Glu-specific endopeptidase
MISLTPPFAEDLIPERPHQRHDRGHGRGSVAVSQGANIRLTGKQLRLLEEGLLSAFRNYNNLDRLLLFELEEHLNEIVVQQANMRDQTFQLIQWAEAQGRTSELLLAAARDVPGNARLREAKESILGQGDHDGLEKIVLNNPQLFSNPDAWRMAMIRAEWAVCRVEKPEGRPMGTGFLVAPDIILTNFHVAHDPKYGDFGTHPEAVRLRFGFREPAEGAPEAGKPYALADVWDIHKSHSNQLDYALVRLAAAAGKDPIGTFQDAPARGRIPLLKVDVRESQGLFILQHPQGDTLKMANGGVAKVAGPWVEYAVNTEEGSSGSPVFNNKWDLVALHSRAGKGPVNKGIAISAIVEDLPDDVKRLIA